MYAIRSSYGTFAWEDSSIVPSGSDSESTLYNVIFTTSTWTTEHFTTIPPLIQGITVKVNKRVNTLNIRCDGVSFGSVPVPSVITNRITSYNVCYTKLLRLVLGDLTRSLAVHQRSFVIELGTPLLVAT